MNLHEIVSLELSNLENERELAADINARATSVDVPSICALILNAGYNPPDMHQEFTEDRWSFGQSPGALVVGLVVAAEHGSGHGPDSGTW